MRSWRCSVIPQALGRPLGERGDGPVGVAGFIATQGAEFGVRHATCCRALGVSQAWFYKWRYGDASPRRARREQLAVAIRRLFAAHRGCYGSPRITADLKDEGWQVSENTVAQIMAELGLRARRRRRRSGHTRPGRGRWRAPDLVGRDFAADQINQKWYGDGTEIPTDEGKLYLDSVLDMGSRRIVGFAMSEHHDTDCAYLALAMAVAVRGGREAVSGVIFHTDRGSEGGFKRSSQHLDQEVLEWDVRQAGLRRRREGRRCGRPGEHRWRIVSIGCGFGHRSPLGRPVRMLGSEPACHRQLGRDGSVRLAGCLHRVSSRTAAAL
jgi:transposase InsO family protein